MPTDLVRSGSRDSPFLVPIEIDNAEDQDFQQDLVREEEDGIDEVLEDEDFQQDLAQEENDKFNEVGDDENGKSGGKGPITDDSDFDTPDEDGQHKTPEPGSVDKRLKQKRPPPDEDEFHSRGIPASHGSISKYATTFDLAGNDPQDQESIIRERNNWIDYATLPPRVMTGEGNGGMDHPLVFTQEMRDAESQSFKEWYLEQGGREEMSRAQNTISLSDDDARTYAQDVLPSHSVLIGPYGKQKLFDIVPSEPLSLREAWHATESQAEPSPDSRTTHQLRTGWLLNLGERIRWLDWAPHHSGAVQYLAVATASNPPPNHPKCTAFESVEPYKAIIYIWSFGTKLVNGVRIMNMDVKPRVVQVVCTEWGAVRRLQWCPAAGPGSVKGKENIESIGLLAGIWMDGWVRVLDIKVDNTSKTRFGNLLLEQVC
ncbi:MAG: hypothetical protein LQ340_004198 [Diploschistes diacapsis]|nr:MAG: hypothetical protein LQ340_004198 [Diploschistes diacapsis]